MYFNIQSWIFKIFTIKSKKKMKTMHYDITFFFLQSLNEMFFKVFKVHNVNIYKKEVNIVNSISRHRKHEEQQYIQDQIDLQSHNNANIEKLGQSQVYPWCPQRTHSQISSLFPLIICSLR